MTNPNLMRSLYFPDRISKAMNGIFNYPLVIVEAPMGYGKTTAVREHLGNTDGQILWQRVYDNSKTIFWNGFCNLFTELDKDNSINLAQLGLPNDNTSRQEALKLLENIVFPEKTVLVIDDYHLISGAEVDSFIEFLTVNEIENLHIVLIVRFIDFPNKEELSLKGYLNHVTKETLEFKTDEIIKYFSLCGIRLKEREGEKLYSYTEGWISALYLLMVNFREKGDFLTTVDISKLVETVVFDPFSEEIKDFLVTMCIFDSFTLAQARFMWENGSVEKLLAEVIGKNAFVNYDANTITYQIHNIFTNFLSDRFNNKEKHYRHSVYQRAAEWFIEKGLYLNAVDYFYKAECYDEMLEAIEKDNLKTIDGEKKDLIIKYFVECPENVRMNHPITLIIFGMAFFSFNEMDLFSQVCGQFAYSIETGHGLSDDKRKYLLGEFEMLLSFTKYNNIVKMSQHHQKAFELLGKPSSIYIPAGSWTFGSPSVMYMFHRESGMLENHVNELKKALTFYYSLTNGYGNGAEYIMEAERYFNIGDFINAEITVTKALYKAQSNTQTGIILCARFLQMRLAFMKGDFAFLMEQLHKMHENIENRLEYLFLYTISICEGFVYSFLNQGNKVPQWIEKGDFNNNRLPFPVLSMINIVYGRTLLIKGEYLKLIGSSAHFLGLASVFPNLLGQIYMYLYLAAANKMIFRQKEAVEAVKQALDIAMPDKVYMPFVENCDYIKPLLELLYNQDIYREDITRILALFEIYHKSLEKMTKAYFSAEEKPGLTDREKEIALLAADGLTNKEISGRLFISTNTVKTALKGIFEKLNVNSRALLKQNMEKCT